MTKDQLMHYCWSRSFKYSDLLHTATRLCFPDIPTEAEYNEYYNEANDFYQFDLDRDYNA